MDGGKDQDLTDVLKVGGGCSSPVCLLLWLLCGWVQ
jgi:hypothetical protein